MQGPFGEHCEGREKDSVRSREEFSQANLGLTKVEIPTFITEMIEKLELL